MTQQQYMQQQMYYQQQQQMYMLQQQQQQQQTMAHQSQHQQANILSIANMTYQQSIHYQQPQNGTTPAAAAPTLEWAPSHAEQAQLDAWFAQLDLSRQDRVHAREAVPFFRLSNLRKEALSCIWGLVDSSSSMIIDRKQFYKMMRLVAIISSQQYAGQEPSLMLYTHTMQQSFTLPVMAASSAAVPLHSLPTAATLPSPLSGAVLMSVPQYAVGHSSFNPVNMMPQSAEAAVIGSDEFSDFTAADFSINLLELSLSEPGPALLSTPEKPSVDDSICLLQLSPEQPVVQPSSTPSTYGKISDSMAILDALVEQDMQANNEDWDEFAGPVTGAVEEEEDFGDFTAVAAAAPSLVLTETKEVSKSTPSLT